MKIHAPVDGLRALRKERGKAWSEACAAADAAGRRRAALRLFGIHNIIRLAQRLDDQLPEA